jgi:hypothetical protein
MVELTNIVAALLISVVGVGYTSYKIGIRKGAEAMVDVLVEQGILVEDEDEET